MNFIQKLFENNIDDLVHEQFVRFGKGTYNRAYVQIKKSKELKIKTSFEFANDFALLIANFEKDPLEVSGKIFTLREIDPEKVEPLGIQVKEVKKKGKYKVIDLEKSKVTPKQLQQVYEAFKLDHLFLSLKGKEITLSSKTALPKPGSKLLENFCTITLPLAFKNEFLFDHPKEDFKEAIITHQYGITDFVIPEDAKQNPEKARLLAKRKGTLKRTVTLDGKTKEKTIPLLA